MFPVPGLFWKPLIAKARSIHCVIVHFSQTLDKDTKGNLSISNCVSSPFCPFSWPFSMRAAVTVGTPIPKPQKAPSFMTVLTQQGQKGKPCENQRLKSSLYFICCTWTFFCWSWHPRTKWLLIGKTFLLDSYYFKSRYQKKKKTKENNYTCSRYFLGHRDEGVFCSYKREK